MRFVLTLLVLAGCPKSDPVVEPVPQARMVESSADLRGADGIRATVVGTLERRRPTGVQVDGTAIVLDDGTEIYLTEEAPPSGWEWMLGTEVRIQGVLWERAPSGWPVPKLLEAEAPMPADVSIPL